MLPPHRTALGLTARAQPSLVHDGLGENLTLSLPAPGQDFPLLMS